MCFKLRVKSIAYYTAVHALPVIWSGQSFPPFKSHDPTLLLALILKRLSILLIHLLRLARRTRDNITALSQVSLGSILVRAVDEGEVIEARRTHADQSQTNENVDGLIAYQVMC